MPTKPFSVRLDPATLDQLEARAREAGESRSRLAQRYIEEGLRMQAHPGIVFRDGPVGRRPAVVGGPDVWEIARVIKAVQDRRGDVIDESVALTGLLPHQIRAAASYYAEYREEIDDWMRRVDEEAERAEAVWLREQALLAR